jgi:hypothetical protein
MREQPTRVCELFAAMADQERIDETELQNRV